MTEQITKPEIRFGTSGIRGETGTEITIDTASRLARACNRHFPDGPVAIGRDSRWGSNSFYHASASQFLSADRDVYGLGLVPNGLMCWFVKEHPAVFGVYITGSHTPLDRNGLIVMDSDGSIVSHETASEIESILNQNAFAPEIQSSTTGTLSTPENLYDRYTDFLLSNLNQSTLQADPKLKVGVDATCGPAGPMVEHLSRSLHFDLHPLRTDPAPNPDRTPEPRRDSISELRTLVQQKNLDLGVAFDIDADRSVFVDEQGNVPSEDLIGALFMEETCPDSSPGTAVIPVNSGAIYQEIAGEKNITISSCRPGPPAMISRMKQKEAFFSAEESGKYIFSDVGYFADGIYSLLKLIEILKEKNIPFSELTEKYPKFYQVKEGVTCPGHHKEPVMQYVHQHFDEYFTTQNAQDETLSGIKRSYPDPSWILIRPSGTEPIIRVYSDASSEEKAEELANKGMNLVESAVKTSENE